MSSSQDSTPDDKPGDERGEKVVDLDLSDVSRDLFKLRKTALPRVRWRLALALLIVISGVIVGTGTLIWNDSLTPEEARDLLAVILTPLFTLLGTVVAFYFKETSNGG